MELTPQEDFQNALYLTVGQLIIPWAFVEHGLTQWVEILYRGAHGKHSEKVIPAELRRKMEFVKRCAKSVPEIKHLEPRILNMIARMHPIIDARHFIVHGALSSMSIEKKMFSFTRLDAEKQNHKIVKKNFTFQRVLKLGEDCLALSKETATFSHELLDIFVSDHERHKLSRKVRA